MTKYPENFIDATSFIKKLLKIKMVTLLLGHPVYSGNGNKRWKLTFYSIFRLIDEYKKRPLISNSLVNSDTHQVV